MSRQKEYVGVSRCGDGTWQYSVRKTGGKVKTVSGFSTAKVAALLRDEYIIRHQLDQPRNFKIRRMAKMRNEAYEQMFGRQDALAETTERAGAEACPAIQENEQQWLI